MSAAFEISPDLVFSPQGASWQRWIRTGL